MPFFDKGFWVATLDNMFKAIGILIVLYGLSNFFSSAFVALDSAAAESFKMIEVAAVVSQKHLQEK